MAFSTEEEESLDSIKRWWNESGKSLLIGVIVFAVKRNKVSEREAVMTGDEIHRSGRRSPTVAI